MISPQTKHFSLRRFISPLYPTTALSTNTPLLGRHPLLIVARAPTPHCRKAAPIVREIPVLWTPPGLCPRGGAGCLVAGVGHPWYNQAMNKVLENVLREVDRLPEEEQRRIARVLEEEVHKARQTPAKQGRWARLAERLSR